jgi:hypothetical protein
MSEQLGRKTLRSLSRLLQQSNDTTLPQGSFRDSKDFLLVKNVSGETIPPYSVLQPVGVILQGTRPVVEVDKFDGTYDGEFLFSWHFEILAGQNGVSQTGRVVRAAYGDGSGGNGQDYGPESGEWGLFEGGGYGISFGQIKAGEMIFAIRGGGGGFEECSGGGILIPGLAESPIVDAQDADYVIGIRDGCLVLIEIGVCTNDDPSGSVSGSLSGISASGPVDPPPPE